MNSPAQLPPAAMLAAALAHADADRPVFPCGPNKRPLTPRGFKDATRDPETIRRWWAEHPAALIAMPTGTASGVFVLDVDQDEAAGKDGESSLRSLCAKHGKLPDTVEAMTPRGGRHLWFLHPGAETAIPNSASALAAHLDIRGDGGYVILPPSALPDGRCYAWEGSSDPDEGVRVTAAPDWLLGLVVKQNQAPASSPVPVADDIPEGRRNETLFRLGRSLRAKGLTEAAILAALQAENGARCRPPMDDTEVASIAGSVASVPAGLSPEYAAKATRRQPPAVLGAADGPARDDDAPVDLAEDDLAQRFIARETHLRYVAPWKRWMLWTDGRVWQEDGTLSVFARARDYCRDEAATAGDKRRRMLLAANTIAAIERLARSDRRAAATPEQFDADDTLMNTPGGVVDLQRGTLGPHDPVLYQSRITAAAPDGECPRWDQFLMEVTGEDLELVSFLRRVAGYAATGLVREHALFFLFGGGANGKGTFINTLVRLFRDYARVAPIETFTETVGDRHPTELAMLRMVRLVVSQETEEGRRWAESRIKQMTGGDPITARFMRGDFFTYEPRFKIVIAGNHKPKLSNVDEAMRRRLHLIPFTQTIPQAQRDPDLAAKLAAEDPGIMRWVVRGAVEYFRHGLRPPKTVKDATAEYFAAQDLFTQWIEDCADRGPDLWEPTSRLYADWCRYAEAAGNRGGDRRSFAGRMESAGFAQGNSRARGGRHWGGLALKASVEVPPVWSAA